MHQKRKEHIAIIGSGLVGSLMACLLAEHGYRVSIFEKRPPTGQYNTDCGRSINLALSTRGWKALDRVGVREQVMQCAIPMEGRMMHSQTAVLTFQRYGQKGEAIFSVSRNQLNSVLLEKARSYDNITLYFNAPLLSANVENGIVRYQDNTTGKKHQLKVSWILGTDGAFSKLRQTMQKNGGFNFSQQYIEHGYKEISIPPNPQGGFRLDPHRLHIWPRREFMLIALPNCDDSFTATLFLPIKGKTSFEQLNSAALGRAFFQEYFPDALEQMPSFDADFENNPVSQLVTIRCNPWRQGRALLLGDAAHAIVPFYGQGMNAGFEDCTVFDDLLQKHEHEWESVMPAFQAKRIPDANAIADLALGNFIEMRDKVNDPSFLLRKKIEARLQVEFPHKWRPLYSMVTFSDVPYARALAEGNKQSDVMDEVLRHPEVKQHGEYADITKIAALQTYLNV